MDPEKAIYFRDQLREARAVAFRDAEAFHEIPYTAGGFYGGGLKFPNRAVEYSWVRANLVIREGGSAGDGYGAGIRCRGVGMDDRWMDARAELEPLMVNNPDLADEIWNKLEELLGDELTFVEVNEAVRQCFYPGPREPSFVTTACHEAGHAVVAVATGCRVFKISILFDADERTMGFTRQELDRVCPETEVSRMMQTPGADAETVRNRMLDRLVSEAAIYAAGPAAELLLGASGDPGLSWRNDSPRPIVRRAARDAEEEELLIDRVAERAYDILVRNEKPLRALADTLLDRYVLTNGFDGEMVDEFFSAHPVEMVPESQRLPGHRERMRRYGLDALVKEPR